METTNSCRFGIACGDWKLYGSEAHPSNKSILGVPPCNGVDLGQYGGDCTTAATPESRHENPARDSTGPVR